VSVAIGIRREDKNVWERRAPLTPTHVRALTSQGIGVTVQRSPIRAFSDEEYAAAGAIVSDDLSPCPVIFAIKEIPDVLLERGKTYVFFSHTIKGQPHNMPALRRLLDLECTLIDYEPITDEQGRRLMGFGRYAGFAGMIETLWALGQRLAWEGIPNPFECVKHAYEYANVKHATAALGEIGRSIGERGYAHSLAPIIVGFLGYGNVSRGAQQALDALGCVDTVAPADLAAYATRESAANRRVAKVVFREEHTVGRAATACSPFDLQHYFAHPQEYESIFEQHLDHLTVLINGIFWTDRCPRLFTADDAERLYTKGQPKLRVIGDISCDLRGGVEITQKATSPDVPAFVYDPCTREIHDGVAGRGPVVMAVDNLPCEFPHEASTDFADALVPLVPAIAAADYRADFGALALPSAVKRAVIAHRGALTQAYGYLTEAL